MLEEVDKAPERERHLLLGGPGEQHVVLRLPAAFDGTAPERGLPDARLALDQECSRAFGNRPRERLDPNRLGFATDDVCGTARYEGGNLAHVSSIGRRFDAF